MKTRPFSLTVPLLRLCFLLAVFAATTATAAPETYGIDPVHSSVIFRVKHLGISFLYGRFNEAAGALTVDDAAPAANALEMSVRAKNIDTDKWTRDRHLRSAEFLHVRKFPHIKFVSTSFRQVAKDAYEIRGDLSLHGVTRPLTLRAKRTGSGKDPWGGWRTGLEATFTVKRSDFGMDSMLDLVGDEVTVTVSLEGVRR